MNGQTTLEHRTNRFGVTVAAGEVLPGVQICPVGDWPNGGRNQHCTEEALNRVVERWKADGGQEVLVDFEHQAEAGGTSDTSAAAWASHFRVEPGRGLVADFRMTDVGAEAVSNRRLRFLSVAWLVNNETREPERITSIALTNKPNIPVSPVLNRAEPDNEDTLEMTTERTDMDIKELAALLGLDENATAEDVKAAVQALLEAKAEAEKEKNECEAEKFAEENKAKCDKAVLKAQYLANREVAKALVAAIHAEPAAQAAKPAQQILNKADAKTPDKDDVVAQLNKLPAGKARVEFVAAHAEELAEAAKI